MAEQQVLGMIFTAIGVGALAAAALLARRPARLLRAGGRASGTVVGVEEDWTTGKGTPRRVYRPKVRFTAGDGRTTTFTSRFGGGKRPAVGDTVRLIYDPAHVDEAEIYSFATMWMFPLVLSLFGLPFLLAGLSVLMGR